MKQTETIAAFGRRGLLQAGLATAVLGASAGGLGRALANGGGKRARRVIFFYFPDGVPLPDGGPDLWFPSGGETSFTLSRLMEPLAPYKDNLLVFKGLSMGGADAGSHPGGAKKLLTGVDGGNGESIDRYLARTFGASAPFRHVYLGAMATQNNAAADKFVSYTAPGSTAPPEDDPRRAFERLFGGAPVGGGGGAPKPTEDAAGLRILDSAFADITALRARLGDAEKTKLDQHTDAFRDIERRLRALGGGGDAPLPAASCTSPRVSTGGLTDQSLQDPAAFPAVLRAQMDVMVLAMACGLTRVGLLQASHHTSELIMSRFAGSELHKPGFDMRSHQASHYGRPQENLFTDYAAQRRWFMGQLAYLLGELKARPEGDGTMLDHSLVVACSEVSDGNTHSHDNVPFVLAGGAGGALRTGRFVNVGYRRHGDLLATIARAAGEPVDRYGQESQGPLPVLA